MKYAKHLASEKLISANEAIDKDLNAGFVCPECGEVMLLKEGYISSDGKKFAATFIHANFKRSNSCSHSKNRNTIPISTIQERSPSPKQLKLLLKKFFTEAVYAYYRGFRDVQNDFSKIGYRTIPFIPGLQKRELERFFKEEGVWKPAKDSFNKALLKMSKQKAIHLEGKTFKENLQQMKEPSLKGLTRFVQVSQVILNRPNNMAFYLNQIKQYKQNDFEVSKEQEILLAFHFKLVFDIGKFLFESAPKKLVLRLTPYFLTGARNGIYFPKSWQNYADCLDEVESIFFADEKKILYFYNLFNREDYHQFPAASRFVSFLLSNVAETLTHIDWAIWFEEWQRQ